MEVEAYTRESIEYDRPPQKVRGTLTTRWVAPLNYLQHLVNGTPVNADTVRPIDDEIPEAVDNANPEGCNQYTGPGCGVGEKIPSLSDKHAKALSSLSGGLDVAGAGDLKKVGITKAVLSDLLKEGYVRRSIDYEGNKETIRYRLTDKGLSAVGQEKVAQVPTPIQSNPALSGKETSRSEIRDVGKGWLDKVEKHLQERAAPVGSVKAHGMTTLEEHTGVTIDGVKFSWVRNDPKALRQAASSVRDIIKSDLHEALWKANGEVVFTSQRNRADEHWEKAYNLPGFKSGATGGDGKVVVYNGTPIDSGLFAHESGHNLAVKEWGDTKPHFGSEYGLAQLSEHAVSPYGRNSPAEDFAEAAKLHTTDPNQLSTKFPLKYRALENLLNKHK